MSKITLDKEEKDILDSFERGEWKQVKNFKAEVKKHQEYARKTLKKDLKILPIKLLLLVDLKINTKTKM